MDKQTNEFEKKYTQLDLLGRGNYGSAYVVRSKQNDKLFVAKKMNLDGMTQAEVEAAKQQIQILKIFSQTNMYPFIVKYIQSFYYERILIIVMEYCQYGDLATFIKHSKKKGELLQQKIILAWFVMLVMGIQALHSKNVLHRDLKSANIFLSSSDFGISKVLDSTSAKTFVGTPYYLSPQVCSNKKYDFRSDLWSLGCILYQLCTFNYPFQANNILSLAMKITSEEAAPIPNKYSKQLNTVVMGLLTKDQNKRKTLQQILQMPYLQKFMRQNGNKIDQICQTIPLKKTAKVGDIKSQQSTTKSSRQRYEDNNNQDTMKTIKSEFQKTNNNSTIGSNKSTSLEYSSTNMSPKDLMKMRKQQKIREEQERLKQYTRDQLADSDVRNFAKSKKQGEFGGSGSNFGHMSDAKTLHRKYQNQNKQIAEQKYKKKNGLNDKQGINLEELSQACTLTMKMNGLTINNSNTSFAQNQPVDLTASIQKKIIAANENFKLYTEPVEEQQIDQELQQYYDQQFQSYQNSQEQKANNQNENDVLKSCLKVFSGQKEEVSPSKLAFVEKAFQKNQIVNRNTNQKKQQCIKKCIALVKPDRYKLLYQMVSQGYKGDKYFQSPQLKLLRVKGSASQKQALRLIQLIKFYQMTQ